MTTTYEARFHSEEYKTLIEDHLSFIRERSTATIPVDENTLIRWAGDFYGLLMEVGVQSKHHFVTARLNGLSSSNVDISKLSMLLIPSEEALDIVLSKLS